MANGLRSVPSFSVGATSMVYGYDLIENVRMLSGLVEDVEIVLFHTPTLNNTPTPNEVRTLRHLADHEGVTFTIHLPSTLELAAGDRDTRKKSVRLAREICLMTEELAPLHYIVHVPISPPTLVAEPENYFNRPDEFNHRDWVGYACDSLEELREIFAKPDRLLVENINYTPLFLEPFWSEGLCGFCLDLGHLLLGGENELACLQRYAGVARVIHAHGVVGYEEHLSLKRLPSGQAEQWVACMLSNSFRGVLTLEVFASDDLTESIQVLLQAWQAEREYDAGRLSPA